jgi:hypothetical protein
VAANWLGHLLFDAVNVRLQLPPMALLTSDGPDLGPETCWRSVAWLLTQDLGREA